MLLDKFFNLRGFDLMFPTYSHYRVPMWSDWKETSDESILKVAVPGYEKEDFDLYVEDGALKLSIKGEKDSLLYSILDSFYSPGYDFEGSKAEYRNGILAITIPKTTKRKQKALQIKIS